ncbi:hypothetical protein IEO21_03333 [Rhodonia placenta]|uniref:Uncharacterized protein n=1 Tax=Rhodonia placenta TaxID=104341 RepID=A0A8H7U440_9APHY|nr:hypothetical protein IEO21_03333 [Postia placenta]
MTNLVFDVGSATSTTIILFLPQLFCSVPNLTIPPALGVKGINTWQELRQGMLDVGMFGSHKNQVSKVGNQSHLAMTPEVMAPLPGDHTFIDLDPDDNPSWTVLPATKHAPEPTDVKGASVHTPDYRVSEILMQSPIHHVQQSPKPYAQDGRALSRSSSQASSYQSLLELCASSGSQTSRTSVDRGTPNAGFAKPKRRKDVFVGVVIAASVQNRTASASKDGNDTPPAPTNASERIPGRHALRPPVHVTVHSGDEFPQRLSRKQAVDVVARPTRHQTLTTSRATRTHEANSVDAIAKYWQRVDDLLETDIAPAAFDKRAVHAYTAEGELRCGRALRFIPPEIRSAAKAGKTKEWEAYTMPRWSQTAELKERLDANLGPGDLNRGLWKRPRPLARESRKMEEDNPGAEASDGESSVTAIEHPSKRLRSADNSIPEYPADVSENSGGVEEIWPNRRTNMQGKPVCQT